MTDDRAPAPGAIGLVGAGRMGLPMAARWVEAGLDVTICDARPALRQEIIELGARWADTPADVARQCLVVATMVSTPADTEAVVCGPNGLLERAAPGGCWIDFGTNGLALTERLAAQLAARGVDTLVAPVTGGVGCATSGTLTVFVGGEPDRYRRLRPLFDAIGRRVLYFDEFRKAITSKLLTNLLWFANACALAEALGFGATAGLNLAELLDIINASSGASWVSRISASCLLDGNYDDSFSAGLCCKDLELIAETAEALRVKLFCGALALEQYRDVVERFGEHQGELAIVRLVEERDRVVLVPREMNR